MDKKIVKERIEDLLEKKGKAHLKDFTEDVAEVLVDVLKIIVEESDTMIDDVVFAPLEGPLREYVDKLDGKEG